MWLTFISSFYKKFFDSLIIKRELLTCFLCDNIWSENILFYRKTCFPRKTRLLFILRGCLCDNWKPSFFPRLIFNWCTFSRRFIARWWRQWAKNQVWTNQNLRNRWCQIARGTICSAIFKDSVLFKETQSSIEIDVIAVKKHISF